MKLTKTTAWSLGTLGLCVALAAGGWFGLVAPERAEAAESRELTVAAEDQNAQLEIRIEQLRRDYADLPARQAELAAVRQALPEEPALAQLIRDVNSRSTDAGTVLDSLTTGAPVAVVDANAVAAAAAPAPAPEASAEPSAAPSAEPSAPPSGAAADPSAVGGPAVAAVPQQPVLAAIPVTVTSTGDFAAATVFLKNLQADMPRALLVDALTLSVLDGDDNPAGTVQSVVTGRVFVFVDPTEVDFAAAPAVEPSTAPSDG